jgi:hypothetical protein
LDFYKLPKIPKKFTGHCKANLAALVRAAVLISSYFEWNFYLQKIAISHFSVGNESLSLLTTKFSDCRWRSDYTEALGHYFLP